MDINDLRGFATILMMVAFIGICWWAFSPKRKKRFDDAANLPFADEDSHEKAINDHEQAQTADSSHDKRKNEISH